MFALPSAFAYFVNWWNGEGGNRFQEKPSAFAFPGNNENFVIIFDTIAKHLQCFNPRNNSFTQMHSFNDEMREHGFTAITVREYVYVLMQQKVYRLRYTDVNAVWERMADVVVDHGDEPPATTYAGYIYVAGSGLSLWSTEATSKYDIALNRWEKMRDKKLPTRDAAVVATKGHVYCIGGDAEGIGTTSRVERFNVGTQLWDEVEPMIERRMRASAVECNDKIVVASGMNQNWQRLTSAEIYSSDVNQWTTMKPMIEGRVRFQCHFIQESIYAVGGDDERRTIEKYDAVKDEWNPVNIKEAQIDIVTSAVV